MIRLLEKVYKKLPPPERCLYYFVGKQNHIKSLAIQFIEYYFFIYFLYIYLLYKSLDDSQLSIYVIGSSFRYLITSVIRLQFTSLKGLLVLIEVVPHVFKII